MISVLFYIMGNYAKATFLFDRQATSVGVVRFYDDINRF